MSAKFFLDTNIFVYCFDEDASRKNQRAQQLVEEALETRAGVISYQVVQEFLNAALRRFETPMTFSEAEQYLSSVLRPLLAIHSSAALYSHALQIAGQHQFAWYDSLIVASAMQAECAVLYTEDLQHGRRLGSLQIVNPFH